MKSEEKRFHRHGRGWSHLCYRTGQLWAVLQSSQPTDSDLHLARSILTEQQMALFSRLQPSEQTHSLRVLKYLLDQGESHPDLLAAALLHDIGKVCYPLRLWERVVIILGKQLIPDKITAWGLGEPKGWRRPYVISCLHPEWGAQLVSQSSASPLLLDLIRYHQQVPSEFNKGDIIKQLAALLRVADDQN